MNTERNLKTLFGSILLSLLVSVGGASALAATQAQSGGATQSSTTAQTATPAPDTTVDSTLTIPVSGSVTAADGTVITFSGNVVVNSSAVTNVTAIAPFVMLTFDCAGVTASSGTAASRKTYDTTGFQVSKIRDLHPSDSVVITVPIKPTGASLTLASAWQVTANLSFNSTGQLTSGTLTAAAVPKDTASVQ